MSKRSFRISPKYEQQEAEIFAHYGISGSTQKELYENFMAKVHEITVANKTANAEYHGITASTIDCIHLVPVETKKTVFYFCVWKSLTTPIKSKKMDSINFCKSCILQTTAQQAYQKPLSKVEKEMQFEEPAPVLEQVAQASATAPATVQQPAEQVFIPVAHWIPMMRSDGSKMCPYTAEMVYVLRQCKDCKSCHKARYSACVSLFYEAEKERKAKAPPAIGTQKLTKTW